MVSLWDGIVTVLEAVRDGPIKGIFTLLVVVPLLGLAVSLIGVAPYLIQILIPLIHGGILAQLNSMVPLWSVAGSDRVIPQG